MNRWLRVSLYALLATGLLLLVAMAAVVAAGPDFARGLVQEAVSEATGREFAIDGAFEPEWGRHLAVTAEDLRLANAEWADEPRMLTVGRLHVVVDLWSLISGPLFIERIEVADLELHLQAREGEPPNWQFVEPPGEPAAKEREEPGAGPGLILGPIAADNVRMSVEGPNLDRPLVLTIRRLRQDLQPGDLLGLSVIGDVNEEPLAIDGHLGPLPNLLAGREISYDLKTRLGESQVDARGTIDDLRAPRRPTAELSVSGPDIGQLSQRLGLGRVDEGGFELQASLVPEGDVMALKSRGALGRIRIDADGTVRELRSLDGVALAAEVSGPALGRILRPFGLEASDDPFVLRTRVLREGPVLRVDEFGFSVADAKLELSAELPGFPTLDDARIDLSLRGSDVEKARALFQLPGIASGPFEVEGHVAVRPDGAEQITLTARTSLARARVAGVLGDPRTYAGTTLDVDLQGDSLRSLGAAGGLPDLPEEPFGLTGAIRLASKSQAEINAATLTVGDDRAEAKGRIGLVEGAAGTGLDVTAAGDDLAQILAMTGVTEGIPAQPYTVRGRLRLEPGALLLEDVDGTVGTATVRGSGRVGLATGATGTDLDLKLEGPDLRIAIVMPELRPYVPAEAFRATGRLRITDAGIAIDNVSGTVAGASIEGSGLLALTPGLVGSSLRVSASGPDLSRIAPELPDFSPPPGPFELEGRMERGRNFIALENTRLVYGGARGKIDARLGLPLDAGVMRFDVELEGPNAAVLPTAAGFTPDPLPFNLRARGEQQADRWRIDASELRLGEASASVSGELSGLPDAPDGRLAFNAAAPSLAALGTFDDTRPMDLPLEVSATIAGNDGRLELDIASARLGGTDVRGQAAFRPGDVPRLDVTLLSSRLNTRELGAASKPDEDQPEASGRTGQRLIPDTPLPLERMRGLDASFVYTADEVVLATTTAADLRLRATMLGGALRVEDFGLSGEAGSLEGTLDLTPAGEAAELRLRLQATDLRTVFFSRSGDTAALPLFSSDLVLEGRGATWRELAASLDGQGWVTSKDGQLPNSQISGLFLGDFVTELFTTLNPFAKTEPTTHIECIAAPFIVEKGIISSLPSYVLRTDKLDIAAWGAVNLATEKIDFNFKVQPRKGLGISASQMVNPFMKIVGTLKEPELTLDPQGTLVTGTATVITGGAWLLFKGAIDSVLRSKDPCGKVMETQAKELAKRGR
jgi:uncharacterized protein involved in outer membrane biogenesis